MDLFLRPLTVCALPGASLTASTLSWEPWLALSNCSHGGAGADCQMTGIVPDIVAILGAKYNFSVRVTKAAGWGDSREKKKMRFLP